MFSPQAGLGAKHTGTNRLIPIGFNMCAWRYDNLRHNHNPGYDKNWIPASAGMTVGARIKSNWYKLLFLMFYPLQFQLLIDTVFFHSSFSIITPLIKFNNIRSIMGAKFFMRKYLSCVAQKVGCWGLNDKESLRESNFNRFLGFARNDAHQLSCDGVPGLPQVYAVR